MNKAGRKQLMKIASRLSLVKENILDIKSDLEYVCDEENTSLDNMDNFYGTDRYAAMEDAANNMNEAIDLLEETVENIDNTIVSVNEASR